jgi:alpha-mannosidase
VRRPAGGGPHPSRVFERVVPAMYRAQPFAVEAWDVGGEPVPFAQPAGLEAGGSPVHVATTGAAVHTWFRLIADVPTGWAEAQLEADRPGSTRLGWFQARPHYLDGHPLQGVHPKRTAAARRPSSCSSSSIDPGVRSPRRSAIRRLPISRCTGCGAPSWPCAARCSCRHRGADGLMPRPRRPRRQRLLRQLEASSALELGDVSGTAAAARSSACARPPARQCHASSASAAHTSTAPGWPLRETMQVRAPSPPPCG